MSNVKSLVSFEVKRFLTAKSTFVYASIYLVNYIISAIFYKLYGSELTVLTAGNGQSFPIQHLQGSYLFSGVFIAIYVGHIIVQERTTGTIKLQLLQPVSRNEYFFSKVLSIFVFSIFLSFLMIILGYVVGTFFFGWGDQLVIASLTYSGLSGVFITLKSGLALALPYFVFGLMALVVAMISNYLLESTIIMGVFLMAGQYLELIPVINRWSLIRQMYFFCLDILTKPSAYIMMSLFSLICYALLFGVVSYFIFKKKDLFV
jgi:ABC-type transport system involved in multi-copper enzyme maturation permease subunit